MNSISLSHLFFPAVYRNPWAYGDFCTHGVGEFSQRNCTFPCQERRWRSNIIWFPVSLYLYKEPFRCGVEGYSVGENFVE